MSDDARPRFSACSFATLLLGASLAIAKSYDIVVDTLSLGAAAVEQVMPEYPESDELRKGQEGWVQLNFVISPEGKAIDAVVVDSSGGEAFERAALDAIESWRFEASGREIPNNSVAIRFEESGDRGMASRNFMRWYRMILTDLASDKADKARQNLERAREFGGWNLYESTILEIVEGKVADVEGDREGRMAALRRAQRMGDETALNDNMRRELLSSLVKVETELRHYASAREHLDALRAVKGSKPVLESLAEEIAILDAPSEDAISVTASLTPPCDCEAGDAVWMHKPSLRSFAFNDIDGNVERFEARCDTDRLSAAIDSQEAWSIPEEWGDCEVFVFGDDGASFEFVELSADMEEDALGTDAMARSNGLDRSP